MSYALPFETIEVKVPVGQYIAIASTGKGNTNISIKNDTQLFPAPFVPLDVINDTSKTYGTYTEAKVIRIESKGAYIEYSVGAMPALINAPRSSMGSYTALPVVVAAATFTTLTYETDAGKVRLVSAGAHGLTAAVAVNKYIYVTWTGGTATSGFYKVTALDADTTGVKITIDLAFIASTLGTPAVKVAGDTVTLATSTIAGYKTKQGSIITIEALYSCSSTTNAKTLGASYGGVAVMTYSVPNSNISVLTHKRICQCSPTEILTNAVAAVGFGVSALANVRSAVDCTASNNLVLTAVLAAANEPLTLESYRVEIEY